jgi:hypothetical protein
MTLFVLLFLIITTYAYIFSIPSYGWIRIRIFFGDSDSDPFKSFGFIWIRIRNTDAHASKNLFFGDSFYMFELGNITATLTGYFAVSVFSGVHVHLITDAVARV